MKFNLLNNILVIDKDLITISPDFVLTDTNQAIELITELENLFLELSVMSEKGFINDPDVNLPVVENIVHHLGLFKSTKNRPKYSGSIILNTLYYNLALLAMYHIVIMINKLLNESSDKAKFSDAFVDLRNVRNNVLRMLHPVLKDRVKKKGIYVTLNSITGYDAEYELNSSLENTNTLLSIQLASDSNLSVKIPNVNLPPLEVDDFQIKGTKL